MRRRESPTEGYSMPPRTSMNSPYRVSGRHKQEVPEDWARAYAAFLRQSRWRSQLISGFELLRPFVAQAGLGPGLASSSCPAHAARLDGGYDGRKVGKGLVSRPV